MNPPPKLNPFRDIRIAALVGISTFAVTIATVGVWAATAPLAGAVIAPGQIVVESNVRRIQHPSGGIVAEIRVNDGDRVAAGDILLRLDDTVTRANLAMIENQLNQFLAREARLTAERDGLAAPRIPDLLQKRTEEPAIAQIITGEMNLFAIRRKATAGLQSQLTERIGQTHEEIRGLTAQAESKREQIRLIQHELDGVRQL
jgi:HlyD family secretion protein